MKTALKIFWSYIIIVTLLVIAAAAIFSDKGDGYSMEDKSVNEISLPLNEGDSFASPLEK